MKPLEDAFSSAGFRRVILPGVILTIGIHPLIGSGGKLVLAAYGIVDTVVLLVAEIIVLGLIISSCINWIYYVYEGFALSWLTAIAGFWNRKYLAAIEKKYNSILNGRRFDELSRDEKIQASLVHEKLLDFPLESVGGMPTRLCVRPTRLGNIIATYEQYSMSRYGVDGVYYWFHYLALAPEQITKQFDEQYAFAESLVLTSFAGAIVAIVNSWLLIGFAIGTISPAVVIAQSSLNTTEATALSLFGAIVFLLFYGLALPAHREVARVFKTVVDLGADKLDKWVIETHAPLEIVAAERIKKRKRFLNALKQ